MTTNQAESARICFCRGGAALAQATAAMTTSMTPRPSLWRQAIRHLYPQVTHEEIAARAYANHLRHTSSPDCALRDWLEAERELLLERSGRA